MYAEKTVVINKTGLHARPAYEFVNMAKKFKSNIIVRRLDDEDTKADAKSIMFLLSLGVCQGDKIEIAAEGCDEKEAVEALVNLIAGGFGELE